MRHAEYACFGDPIPAHQPIDERHKALPDVVETLSTFDTLFPTPIQRPRIEHRLPQLPGLCVRATLRDPAIIFAQGIRDLVIQIQPVSQNDTGLDGRQ